MLAGRIEPGEKLPSVRDFALKFKINPNTAQKALNELEEVGLIITERTNGKYATENTELIEDIRNEYAENLTREYKNKMKEIGF